MLQENITVGENTLLLSQVLDFLILVGKVEETTAAKGDSAETALNVCGDDETKVVDIQSCMCQ